MLTKDEARQAIRDEWRNYPDKSDPPTGLEKLGFYGWLRSNRPDLLSFRAKGDKWQVVKGWLLDL